MVLDTGPQETATVSEEPPLPRLAEAACTELTGPGLPLGETAKEAEDHCWLSPLALTALTTAV